MDATYVIRKPVLTEKSTYAMNEENRYTFEVDRRATKTQIKDAVEQIYGVRVIGVNTSVTQGRGRRLRYGYVSGGETKKAVVRLQEGQVIELF
jgi:large subunit ribosomal protein L23